MYLVKVYMSYDESVESAKELDERRKEITFRYDRETRLKIAYVREKRKREAYQHTVRFFDLHFATEEGLQKIEKIVEIADKEMKQIDKNLYAKMITIPLSIEELKNRGELYEKIYYAICLQMAEAVFNHVKKLKSDVPSKRSKRKLEELLKKFEEINVLGDIRINEKIQELRVLINKTTDEIREQIIEDIEMLRSELQEMMM